ncbi:MAG: carboxylesterase family protein [Prevotellaceae bacterium]|jgi:para-nitrobenzyl esterase|nr:carboxylesterase family protein [Prevotellaceae bacterium]
MKRIVLLLPALLLLASCHTDSLIDVRHVSVSSGVVAGKAAGDGAVKIFMGVPFAAPPVGALRWKAPQAVAAWKGVRECTAPPASAVQKKPVPFFCWSKEFLIPEEPISEDCLYLNVWTSAKTSSENLPVIVWIHGGGFTGGSGTVPLYNGERLARKGVVFVTISYRLGALGFLAHPELAYDAEGHSGNLGLLDQIFALKWIRENIAAFGGNPDCVTIAGQSAGSMSVHCLMASPLAKGLFHRCIGQSGAMMTPVMAPMKLEDAEKAATEMLGKAGLTAAQLRGLPADSLLNLPARFTPVEDGYVLPNPLQAFEGGRQNDVPLLTGWNKDDDAMFGPSSGASVFGDNNRAWASLQSKTGKNPAYLYFFTHVPSTKEGEQNFGAFHSAEFSYALHTLHLWDKPFTEKDYALESSMSSYWVNFAATGNPNGEGLPVWPAFSNDKPEAMELGDELKVTPLPF